jgi:hypothetical protein
VSLAYGICDTRACYGVGDAGNKLLAHMRNGKELILTTYNRQGKAVAFKLPLAGLDAALAGKGLTQLEFEELQRARANALKARGDLAREALLREQRKSGVD